MVLKNVENLSSSKISFVNLAYKNYVICKETMCASPRLDIEPSTKKYMTMTKSA